MSLSSNAAKHLWNRPGDQNGPTPCNSELHPLQPGTRGFS
jgi:hypothetical protein